jgi:hypothetical protein
VSSLQQPQGVEGFLAASHWCEKANLMMGDKERLTEVVLGGCSSEKRSPTGSMAGLGVYKSGKSFKVLKRKRLHFRIKKEQRHKIVAAKG